MTLSAVTGQVLSHIKSRTTIVGAQIKAIDGQEYAPSGNTYTPFYSLDFNGANGSVNNSNVNQDQQYVAGQYYRNANYLYLWSVPPCDWITTDSALDNNHYIESDIYIAGYESSVNAQGLIARTNKCNGSGGQTFSGYMLGAKCISGTPDKTEISIWLINNSVRGTRLAGPYDLSKTLSQTIRLRMRVVGTVISGDLWSGTQWDEIITVTDSTFTGNYGGVSVINTAHVSFDNVVWGNIT